MNSREVSGTVDPSESESESERTELALDSRQDSWVEVGDVEDGLGWNSGVLCRIFDAWGQ